MTTPTRQRWLQDPTARFVAAFVIGCLAEYLLSRLLLPVPIRLLGLWQGETQSLAAALFAIAGAGLVWAGSWYGQARIQHRGAMRAIVTATLMLMAGFGLLQTATLSYAYGTLLKSGVAAPWFYSINRVVGWLIPIGVGIWLYRQTMANELRAIGSGQIVTPEAAPDALRRFLGNLLIAVGVLMLLVAGACAVILGAMDQSLLPTVLIVSGVTALIAALPILLGRWLRQSGTPKP